MIWIIAGIIIALLIGLFHLFMRSSPETIARYLIIAVRPFFTTLTVLAVLFEFWKAALPLYVITVAVLWFAPLPETRESRESRARRERRRQRARYERARPQERGQSMTLDEACQLLQISPTASRQDINAAYKRLMLETHPDKGGSNAKAARLNEAREILFRHASG